MSRWRWLTIGALCAFVAARSCLGGANSAGAAKKYFAIEVVDGQTGRGVPLVELRTVNNIRYYTDSGGVVAFYEPGLMDRDVFFFVESHGYEFPKDGFGMQGTRLKTSRGASAVVKVKRLNVAERLYRVTGQGIYRDSILTGREVPLRWPALNGQVVGQDSVFTCLYGGRIFWMWGDTARASYPLGNFAMSGAYSDVPGRGGLEPSVGVDLEYIVGEDGFSRPVAPLKERGLVWLDGLLTVKDNEGRERMVARYARLKDLGTVLERGLMAFNDSKELFEPLVRSGVEFMPFSNTGHSFGVDVGGQEHYYFTTPSPVAVRMRVRATWEDVIDANRYEVFTSLEARAGGAGRSDTPLARGSQRRWVRFGELTGGDASAKAAVIKALEKEEKNLPVRDIESGKEITSHNGTVYFNRYRRRWVAIFVQQFGENSFLGEVWYAEADTPVGPWGYARRIVTHKKYSFYNPKHHPLFDVEGGRVIFFEGTYSHTFSGSPETATPRYDYNQIMYRMNLDDARLRLPAAVYRVGDGRGGHDYMMRESVERAGGWGSVESVAFYAMEPGRAGEDMVGVYRRRASEDKKPAISLTTKRPDSSAEAVFFALPAADKGGENLCVTELYEYRRGETGRRLYSTDAQLDEAGWARTAEALCRVWKAPAEGFIVDRGARPTAKP